MTINKHTLVPWVREALKELGGTANIADVSRAVWSNHRADLEGAGDLFYTWQYDLRWAAHELRRNGLIRPAHQSPRGVWELTDGR